MTLALLILAAFLGGFVQSAAGFGSALVAMPLMAMAIDVRLAAPLFACLSPIVSAGVLWRHRDALNLRDAAPLIAGSIAGIPVGLWALKAIDAMWVEGALGVVLVAYGSLSLLGEAKRDAAAPSPAPDPRPLAFDRGRALALAVGFVSGALGGAYNTSGPPLIVYGAAKRWPRERFKSVLQSCYLVGAAFIVAGHGAGGLLTAEVFRLWLILAPGLALGIALGSRVDRWATQEQFARGVMVLVVVLGASLLAKSWGG